MACDGDVATEEIDLLRKLVSQTDLFNGIDIEGTLKRYVDSINQNGVAFLNQYLSEVAGAELTKDEQIRLIDLALKTIEADNRIEYSEVKFFKKIRFRLPLTDDEILAQHPDKEDFLLPDLNVAEDPEWNNVTFTGITLKVKNLPEKEQTQAN